MKKRLLLLVCLLSCFLPLLHAQVSPFRTEPYLQNPTQESVTIMWHTENPAYGWVEYGKTDKFGEKADMVIDGLRNANTTIHKIRLTNLEPGSTYYYRACFKPIVKFSAYEVVFADVVYSKTSAFNTISASNPRTSCVIFNDLHSNYAMFNRLCNALVGTDYQFSIFNGDCFPDPRFDYDVLEALAIYNEGISAYSRPAFYIRGNHEARGAFARDLKKVFDFPDNEFFFAMTAGPIRFIFLDCGEDKTDDHSEYSGLNDFTGYRERQKEWLKKEVQSAAFRKAKYRILIHHIPLYRHENRGISVFSRTLWSPVLDAVPIDIAISGHVHRYGFVPVKAVGNHYPALTGGGSRDGTGTAIVLSATDEQLSIEVLNDNGEIISKYEKLANKEMKATLDSAP